MLHPDGATVPPKSIAYLGHRHRRCFVCISQELISELLNGGGTIVYIVLPR